MDEFDIEKIVLELGDIAADDYLGKEVLRRLPQISQYIKLIKSHLDSIENMPEEYTHYVMSVGYAYYTLKDKALSSLFQVIF